MLRWKIEFLVYFFMLIPNIVFILHKEQFSKTKIAKYYLFSMELDALTRSDKTKKVQNPV
jgi:hypothetical protein